VFLVELATDIGVIASDFARSSGAADAGSKPGRWPKRLGFDA
jgi:hypothetical protein